MMHIGERASFLIYAKDKNISAKVPSLKCGAFKYMHSEHLRNGCKFGTKFVQYALFTKLQDYIHVYIIEITFRHSQLVVCGGTSLSITFCSAFRLNTKPNVAA